jgi:phosphoglucosamine mutase
LVKGGFLLYSRVPEQNPFIRDADIRCDPMKFFGSSGIRGLVNKDITAELAMDIGRVLGTIHSNVVIGHDTRISRHLFLHAITSGLLSAGCGAAWAGMVTTPTLACATRTFDCGVMITASHNPPEYNGVKFFNPDGSGFGISQMEEIEQILENRHFKTAHWENIKTPTPYENAIEKHMEEIMKHSPKLDLKVVVDAGCGAASTITPYLFSELGCRVVTINCQPDGLFPGRPSEPSEENLEALSKTVVASGADLGIAHDGDADRMVAVDEKGNYAGGDALLALFAGFEAKNSIVVPVNASMAVDDVVGDAQVIRTRVGDVFISQKIRELGADFGGEPSGTWIFPGHSLCPDGIFAAVRLAQCVAEEPLSSQIARLPTYPRKKGTIACPNDKKDEVLDSVKGQLETMNPVDIGSVDGIRAQFESAWALVRASGTEPKIRVTVEARTSDEASSLYDNVYEVVRGCVEG